MKKIIVLLLSGVLAVSMAGCGSSDEQDIESQLENMTEEDFEKALEALDESEGGGSTVQSDEPEVEETIEISPFNSLSVTFSGISPCVEAALSGGEAQVTYNVDSTTGLKNGDVLKVTAKYTGSKDNVVLTETSREYTVSGMPSYFESVEDIPQATYEKMDNTFRDGYAAYLTKNGSQPQIQEMTLLGNYVLTKKNVNTYGTYNYIYFVYKVNANFRNGENHDYYWCAYYQDAYILADGTVAVDFDNLNMGLLQWNNLLVDGFYIESCADTDDIFYKNVTSKIDEYNYVSTVEE